MNIFILNVPGGVIFVVVVVVVVVVVFVLNIPPSPLRVDVCVFLA